MSSHVDPSRTLAVVPPRGRGRLVSAGRAAVTRLAVAAALVLALFAAEASAQLCPGTTVVSDLRRPIGLALSNQGNVLVSETGTPTPNSGRLSIVSPGGARRTLLDGLPSGIGDVGDPSGPSGVIIRGRTAYLLIGIGDSALAAPVPGRQLPNPNPSSPIFSSVLAIHFSAAVEKRTAGFTLSQADQEALAAGETVTLSNGGGDSVTIELVADFPDHIPNPLPEFPEIVRSSNPFSLVLVADQLYVTDGGRNLVWKVDVSSGDFAALAEFPTIPNPLFPGVGGPETEAVPTGIAYDDGQLLVTLFRGVPFPPGTSVVLRIDPATGAQEPFITGLKTAIDIVPEPPPAKGSYLVLQHSSGDGPFFPGPGLVLRFPSASASPETLADCLERPTSMVLDEKTGTLYVAELLTGRLAAFR